jgi:hypothetical protein
MGVYHLMGLGRSPGTVTGPLSYLAHRYQRWNDEDASFFSTSGEWRQRERGDKVGDVQAIVLFTTPEVIHGKDQSGRTFQTFGYVKNQWGKSLGQECSPAEMRIALGELLPDVWKPIAAGRTKASLFWCEIDRRDILNVYQRVVQVTEALRNVGSRGKEIWANLTGGNNVTNSALELGSYLSADFSRMYYVQAHDPQAEKCVYYTAEQGYWVDLPLMPLALGRLRETIMALILAGSPIPPEDIYSRLTNQYYDLARGLANETVLMDSHPVPMQRQGLIRETDAGYVIGPQWELIQPYLNILENARRSNQTIEQLAASENWITHQEFDLH